MLVTALVVGVTLMASVPAQAQGDSSAELARKLQNPVANLISVPLQSNWDFGIGRSDAMRYTLNVQPVIPISLGKDWNLITRTIVPFIHAESTAPGGDAHGGIGDIVQSFFLSPQEPVRGWIVGAESTRDWKNSQWTVPINVTVSQLLKLGGQPIQLGVGGRYYAERPSGGPGWGIRFTLTFLFPK